MVSTTTIVFMVFSAILSALFPIILGIILLKKYKKVGTVFVIGGLSFFVLQILIRMPLMQTDLITDLLSELPLIVYILILAFTAGLFETIGRVLFIKLLLKKNHNFEIGLAHGIGHGGIEAIVLVTLSYINYLIYAFMINAGTFQVLIDVSSYGVQSQLILIKNLLIDTESYIFLIAGIERIFAIILHIGLSVIVMYGFKTNKKFYFLIVLAIHFLVDFIAGMMSQYLNNILWTELFMFFTAIAMIYVIILFKNKYERIEE